MSETLIKVLVVDNAHDAVNPLIRILESDPHICVLGMVETSSEALKFISRSKPDLITIDIGLPGADGLNLTREVMEKHPIPIVVVGSAQESLESTSAFDMLKSGALATVEKPVDFTDQFADEIARRVISTVKTMAEIKLVRRRPASAFKQSSNDTFNNETELNHIPVDLVAMGASTGGPGVIQRILKELPNDFPAPILIAQHIAPGFTDGLVHWLATTTGFTVKICCQNEKLRPACAYLCPEGFQTGISGNFRVKLTEEECVNGVRPSVSYLFASIAEIPGKRVVAVLLTGMGKDGADELKLLKEKGGITIVQDAESSLVHGMPGEAIRIGAAQHVVPAKKIPDLLVKLAGCRKQN